MIFRIAAHKAKIREACAVPGQHFDLPAQRRLHLVQRADRRAAGADRALLARAAAVREHYRLPVRVDHYFNSEDFSIYMVRNFFGVLSVTETSDGRFRVLWHGTTGQARSASATTTATR